MDRFLHLKRCSNYWSSCEILSFIQIDDKKNNIFCLHHHGYGFRQPLTLCHTMLFRCLQAKNVTKEKSSRWSNTSIIAIKILLR